MPTTKSTVIFSGLREPLTAALRRLIEKDDDLHPFVIVKPASTEGVFVQFAGAKNRPLCYDCPPLGVFNDRCMLDVAVDRGIEGLRTQGVQPDSDLRIIESENKPSGGIRDLFRRLREAF